MQNNYLVFYLLIETGKTVEHNKLMLLIFKSIYAVVILVMWTLGMATVFLFSTLCPASNNLSLLKYAQVAYDIVAYYISNILFTYKVLYQKTICTITDQKCLD